MSSGPSWRMRSSSFSKVSLLMVLDTEGADEPDQRFGGTTAMGYIIVVVNSVRDFRHRRRPSTASRTLFIASSLTAFTDSQKQPRYDHTCCASLPAQLPAHSFQAGWLTGWLAAGCWLASPWLACWLSGWLAGIQWSP